jgi:hypothetical protein
MTSRDNLFSVLWYAGLAGILGMLAVALIACVSVPYGHADGLPKTSRVADPWQPAVEPTVGWKAHNFYLGAVGSYGWHPDMQGEGSPLADEWQLGLLAGYLYRTGATGFAAGVEVDWTPHELNRLRDDDGTLTVRGRAGAFVSAKTFVYGTAGFLYDKDVLTGLVMQGPVVGGGMEVDIAANLALRVEVLHLRYGADYLDWGDEGSTQARVGAAWKF